jgi:D-alanine-D-alanine ligase-like ATP-grasp enzyme
MGFWSRLSLHRQLILVSSLLLLVTLLVTTLWNVQAQRRQLIDEAVAKATSLAQSAALASREKLVREHFDDLEALLLQLALFPDLIELAVLGDRVPQVSGPGEIRPGADFYDYADKYETDAAELVDDPDLDPETAVRFQELAARAFLALRCSGMARVDFFLADDGRGPVLNEVNTIPGFTPISMYPRLWQKAGLSYPALVDRLVDLAVERHARRRRNTHR